MKNRPLLLIWFVIFSLVLGLISEQTVAQKKEQDPKSQQKKSGKPPDRPERATASAIPDDEVETYREQASQLVKFYENTLNFLADKQNTIKEKDIIINESYLKFFWDSEVQIEDDLDVNRLVPLYKDVQAYLSDVDFFFKSARFQYDIQDVNVQTNDAQQTFFKVTANRTLQGVTVNGDSVNSNLVRYIEMNYNGDTKQLKIVSVYTTKLNEKEDLRNWWNALSEEWRAVFGQDLQINQGLPLSKVTNFNDTVAIVDGIPVEIRDSRIYGLFLKIIDSKTVDLSGDQLISDPEPLSKLSSLTTLNLSNTPVHDLMPLRNLNALEILNISGTMVASLEPLKYCNQIKELRMSNTPIENISLVETFDNLEILDISNTSVSDLAPLKSLLKLKELYINHTQVSDLTPLSGLINLQILDISTTPVSNLNPLKDLKNLHHLSFNQTRVKSLAALENLPELTAIYCDNSLVSKSDAVSFMLAHPGVVVIFATEELDDWWSEMPAEWKKVFQRYGNIQDPPAREQLNALMTIDSVNINGRMAITSLSPLTELPRLRWLDCSNTSITAFDPLISLFNIQYLNAGNTGITSLNYLNKLDKIQTLNIENTKVKDLDPLKNLNFLTLILADRTGIDQKEAYEFLDKHPDCQIIFQTTDNANWWKGLNKAWKESLMKQLNLQGTPDKFQLQQIAGMDKLIIENNPSVTSVQPAVYLTRLKEFVFSDTRVPSLSPLQQMTWLKSLGFPKNPIYDLSPISNLTGLVELNFENTQVEDLSPVQNLTNLEVLKLSGTPVKTLKYIKNLTKLRVVNLFNTKISSLNELDGMQKLESIQIFNTKINAKRVEKFKQSHPGCEVVYY